VTRAIKTRSSRREPSPRNAEQVRAQVTPGWTIRRARDLRIVESRALAKLGWLTHGFSTRPGGQSILGSKRVLNLGFTDWDDRERVAANRAKFVAALSARDMHLVTLRQFHSDVIHVADEPVAGALNADAPSADALATRTAGLLLGVQAADCVPILLADTRHRAVAAIHAGWRGTLARVAVKALGRMRMEFGTRPRDVVAALGPSIGRCCYEVGSDVARSFAAQFPNAADWFDGPFDQLAYGEDPLWLPWLTMMPPGHVPPPPRVQLDLRACNRWQLIDAGIPETQIDVSDLCTACRTDLLFSYRREGVKTGRLIAVIGVRSKK
jgi:purine-nucleoside/S-methyl-5'-thioadenosine phosphorylase / adenosine deaminase